MQMVIGFFFGYIVIAKVLLPVYYRLNLTSIYEYLRQRFGVSSYRTGAWFFIFSKMTGAAARLFLVVMILQNCVFDSLNIPFAVTVAISILLIWAYTFRSGIKTIIQTDMLQAICLVAMLVVLIMKVTDGMGLDFGGMIQTITDSPHFRMFEFGDWSSRQHFVKQFLSGVFIPIVMTGLDQDMMQKNLSCRNLREAQKNMYLYGASFMPVNFMFLSLGILIVTFMGNNLPIGDDMLPALCTSGILGQSILIFFTIGIIAAAFSSADSALTAITTSICIDILGTPQEKRKRIAVHITVSVIFMLIIMIFKAVNDRSVIDAIYTIASYTYGPLLGLFIFGLFTKYRSNERLTPYICVAAPVICFLLDQITAHHTTYRFGYELLLLNGTLTFAGMYFTRTSNNKKYEHSSNSRTP
jgi:Na+/proline symporter